MSAADALVDGLPRTTLVVGKGGVGKTTCASALAIHAAARVGSTLLLSTDPARALPTVLGAQVGAAPEPVAYARGLAAQALDAGVLRARFMERWSEVIRTILDRGTYLDDEDVGPLVDTALPGSDEIFAALELATLLQEGRSEGRIIVDTAPTGHTLRLLNLPRTFRALVRLLEAMQSKHRFMVRTLTRTYRPDAADAFLTDMTRLVAALEQSLVDRTRCAAVLVTNPEPLVREESLRYLDALRELRIHVAAVVWNATDDFAEPLGDADQYIVPRLDEWPTGESGLRRWLSELKTAPSRTRRAAKQRKAGKPASRDKPSGSSLQPPASNPQPPASSLIRPLTIVAGKGGVGKTTVAAALGICAAEHRRTLVVSTDPAPSLADALAQPIPDADTAVDGVPKLSARQMDATAAFNRLRDEYQSRVDALFQGLVARGVDLAHDRAVARDLLSLAPPGIDEVYALSLISDALFVDRHECVVVDPAPTGHLLRLLEMPQLALAWSHQLMRLMLKYREIAGLGETAREILTFSQSLRAVDTLLRDPARTAVVLVALDEPVVMEETARLADEVSRRGVGVSGIVVNRAGNLAPLPVPNAPLHFEAPMTTPPPSGVNALRQWTASWRPAARPRLES
ncbi:MAG: ArsA family ATPase [Gemmatimonadaceae bacterium]